MLSNNYGKQTNIDCEQDYESGGGYGRRHAACILLDAGENTF